jgi:hypothetical protein
MTPLKYPPTFDRGPVNVKGDDFRAEMARVLWFPDGVNTYGTLVVLLSRTAAKRVTTTKPTKVKEGRWEAVTKDGNDVRFDNKGCASCGWPLGSLPIAQIWELAHGDRDKIDLKQPK